jgi:hypothetical protein
MLCHRPDQFAACYAATSDLFPAIVKRRILQEIVGLIHARYKRNASGGLPGLALDIYCPHTLANHP